MPRPLHEQAEMASDALFLVLTEAPDAFDGAARDAIGQIRQILEEIAEGKFPTRAGSLYDPCPGCGSRDLVHYCTPAAP